MAPATPKPSVPCATAPTGVITGSAAATSGYQRVTVEATDAAGKTASTGFWEGVFAGGLHGCGAIEQLADPGFENGSADVNHTPMTDIWSPSGYNVITPSSLHAPHSGNWYAWLGQSDGDSITQYLDTYPGYTSATFSFWLDVESTNPSTVTPDTLSLVIVDQYTGQPLGTAKTWSSRTAGGGYQQQTVDLSPYLDQVGWGTTVGLELVSHVTEPRRRPRSWWTTPRCASTDRYTHRGLRTAPPVAAGGRRRAVLRFMTAYDDTG